MVGTGGVVGLGRLGHSGEAAGRRLGGGWERVSRVGYVEKLLVYMEEGLVYVEKQLIYVVEERSAEVWIDTMGVVQSVGEGEGREGKTGETDTVGEREYVTCRRGCGSQLAGRVSGR